MDRVKLVATDLDGTFLRNDKSVSARNREMLGQLGERQVVRVAATGRNLKKVHEVLDPEVPFDYIVFSSGAGIFDWQNKKHIYGQNIQSTVAREIAGYLLEQKIGFFAFRPVPENHYLWFYRGTDPNDEFTRYFSFHNSFSTEIGTGGLPETEISQFLLILPDDAANFNRMKEHFERHFPEIVVIRTSSPLGTPFIWMELFDKTVSKGNALSIICKKEKISREETIGIGNDYNDLELLNFTRHSFLVANSPGELSGCFNSTPSNEEDAFSWVVQRFFLEANPFG